MGDWADMYDYGCEPPQGYTNYKELKNLLWIQKNGEEIAIGNMTDRHLLNAYKMSCNGDLFKEMVVRLFEKRLGDKND